MNQSAQRGEDLVMATFIDFVKAIQRSTVALGFPKRPIAEGTPLTKESVDLIPLIVGTGFQAAAGKLSTCGHVLKALAPHHTYGEARIITIDPNERFIRFWAINEGLKYLDKESKIVETVDCGIMLMVPKEDGRYPVNPVRWGDSDQVEIGEEVGICGFPMGSDLFIDSQNKQIRGFGYTVQRGIISAILPVDHPSVSRELFQLDIQTYGGMSGGPVFLTRTGEVIGMVRGGITRGGSSTTITYAVPGNLIKDYCSRISFVAHGKRY